ncbi:uncharacterized protein LOC129773462 [Toxorhynchites rutilus septentrionalis]|uniref:uncharacterized protein LOC129773462 n=1 Tax=Toxorhynchites rutilus septentrionalis TaxID=329112 RepID=UPI00247A84B9|nr:uncharacterized protein LOC129773462 [Toxorhynchites rutilus septentrionalis]
MFASVLAVIIATLCAILYWIHKIRHRFASKWPSLEPCYPLIGNAAIILGKDDMAKFKLIEKVFTDTETIKKVWAGPKLFLITSHPDVIQKILTSPVCLDKPFLYRFAGYEQGLFTARYHAWKEARKRLDPCFNQRILNGFLPIFVKCAQKMADGLKQYADGQTVNIHKFTALCFLEMGCGTTLGTDVLQRDGKAEFEHGLNLAFKEASKRMISVHLYPDFVYRLTKNYQVLTKARKTICDFSTKLVDERRVYLNKCSFNNNNEERGNKWKILIDQLLSVSHDGKTFTEQQITDNIYAVISGAIDTTSLVTAYACIYLAFYPDIQDRLYREMSEHLPNDDSDSDETLFTPEAIKQLRYTEMFLKEVLRHCTVVPYIARQNIDEIEIDGVVVPPGNTFIMSMYTLHRRPDVWGPNAGRFDPENFSEERMRDRHPFSFNPFSGGNRICIGWRYAMLAIKVTMVLLVKNFTFETKIKPEDIRFKHDLTLKMNLEHLVQIRSRNVASFVPRSLIISIGTPRRDMIFHKHMMHDAVVKGSDEAYCPTMDNNVDATIQVAAMSRKSDHTGVDDSVDATTKVAVISRQSDVNGGDSVAMQKIKLRVDPTVDLLRTCCSTMDNRVDYTTTVAVKSRQSDNNCGDSATMHCLFYLGASGMFVLIVIVVVLCAVLYVNHRQKYRFARDLPGLKPLYPILGNGDIMLWKTDVQRFDTMVKICTDHDRLVKVWAGPRLLLFTCHPDLVQQILSSPDCLEKPFLYSFAGFEQGLFTAKYKTWRVARKRLNPSFNQRILHGFIPIFAKCARNMIARMHSMCPDGATINIHKFTSLCTLEMACGTTLGSDVLKREGKEEFVHGLDVAFNEAARRMVSVHLYLDIVYRITKHYTACMKARKVVCDFFQRLVTERREELQLNDNNNGSIDSDFHKPKILIDQLLSVAEDGRTFSENEINDNIYAVITGANDTTGLLIAHACLFLCFHKDIQEKLYAEVMEHMPTDDVEIDSNSLKQLVYLEMFLKECLRHCPVAPNVARENMAEIEIDGVKVPPGNIFVMNFYALHRRKDIWGPDAKKFDPEQFSEERSKNRHPSAYLPFSGGNRICIGWRYAMFSMKVMLIYLVRNFQFDTKIRPEDVQYRHDLTMKLPFDHMVQVRRRCRFEAATEAEKLLRNEYRH